MKRLVTLDLKRNDMSSSASDLLRKNKDQILNVWEEKVKSLLPAARLESRSALRNSIPEFLDDLILALETNLEAISPELIRFAHKHGAERANLSEYSIEDALTEFNILRKVIFSEIELERELSSRERNIIIEAIHFGVAKAGAEYAKMQMKSLQVQQERLSRITDIQPGLIGLVDTNFRYIFANKAYESWFNLPADSLIGKTVREVVGEEAYKVIRPHLEIARKGEKTVFENHVSYKAGGDKFTHSTFSPNFDAQGRVNEIYISVTDNTLQRKALEKSMRSEEEFRSLANALPQLAWIANTDGSIAWFNDRFYEFTGLTKERALGWGWLEVHDLEYLEFGKTKYLEHLKLGEIWEDVFRIMEKNGKWKWFLSRALPLKDPQGNIYQWLGTNTDITDQKNTADNLHQEQVMREKFISALSHDLRTPLTSATLSSQLIPRKTKDTSIISLAHKITQSLKRVDKMIEDLLDANRLRAGKKFIPVLEELDLAELTRRTVRELETIYGDRFVVDTPESLYVHLSSNGIRRVIENFCSNAIKYGSSSAPVSVHLHSHGEMVELGVHNFGNPLHESDASKLFEEFSRSSVEEKNGKKGWGIGLSIVKGVAEAHGGEVDVESDESGTTFKIYLPLDARKVINVRSIAPVV
jgi:PAS domain S-box-containing protein